MEDFYMNITSQDNSYDYSDIPDDEKFIMDALTCVIIGVGLPLTLVAICALHSQVRNDYVAPIYVINLLISDLIQLCTMIVWVETLKGWRIPVHFRCTYFAGLVVSVCFMVCIALERCLVVTCPLWYRCRRTIKNSVVICVLVWVLAPTAVLTFIFCVDSQVRYITFSIILLLPLPLFIFFLGGTLKALSASISVPSDEKRRIVGVLVLVLLIYALLFLPAIIEYLLLGTTYDHNFTLCTLSNMFLRFSPLADLTLYVFMRKGTVDKLLSSVCCCRMDSDDTNSPSV